MIINIYIYIIVTSYISRANSQYRIAVHVTALKRSLMNLDLNFSESYMIPLTLICLCIMLKYIVDDKSQTSTLDSIPQQA